MNEYNYNQEEPDEHWNQFRNGLITIIIVLLLLAAYGLYKIYT